MARWTKVVVGVDGSGPSRSALRWAADEAAEHGAELLAVMAWSEPVPPIPGIYGRPPTMDVGSSPYARAAQALADLVTEELGDQPAVPVKTELAEGNPARVLIDKAADADLLVVGSRGHGGFAGLLLGSTSQHVSAHAHGAVAVVR
jgi:nucleotide-binding universal stress UspA family protein